MNKYELVYIIDAHAAQSAKDDISKQVGDALAKSNLKMINTQVWLERHKMSFPINKIWEGTYYLLSVEGPSESVNKLRGLLRINEQVLRFMTVRQQPLQQQPAQLQPTA